MPVQPKQQEVRAAEPDVVNRPSILKDVGAAMAGNFDPLSDTLAGKWKQFQGAVNPPLTDNQEKAAKFLHAMLEPGRLGGEDRTFNHRDAEAVGKGITARSAKGIFARSGIAESRIRKGLTEAGVVEDKDAAPDTTERKLSLKSLDNLEKAQKILGQRSQFLEKLNLREDAKLFYQKVVKKYRRAAVAKDARARLKQLEK